MSTPTDSASSEADAASFWDRHGDRILGGSVLLLLAGGTLVYSILEDWSLVDSFYFSSVALTAVGFGDLTPSSDLSKILTVLYIFAGVAVVAVWIRGRTKARITRRAVRSALESADADNVDSAGPPDEASPS